jgi:hypothetical protein
VGIDVLRDLPTLPHVSRGVRAGSFDSARGQTVPTALGCPRIGLRLEPSSGAVHQPMVTEADGKRRVVDQRDGHLLEERRLPGVVVVQRCHDVAFGIDDRADPVALRTGVHAVADVADPRIVELAHDALDRVVLGVVTDEVLEVGERLSKRAAHGDAQRVGTAIGRGEDRDPRHGVAALRRPCAPDRRSA